MSDRKAPSAVDFSHLLPLGVKGTSKGRSFMPNTAGPYTSTNNIIRIPLNSTGFLDGNHSYLSFDCLFGSAGGGTQGFDGSAHSLIRQLRIEGSDGSELERVDNYNVIQSSMSDLQVGQDHAGTILNELDDTVPVAGVPTVYAAATTVSVCLKLMSGKHFNLPLCRDKSPTQVMCC